MNESIEPANHLWDEFRLWALWKNRERDVNAPFTAEEKVELLATMVFNLVLELQMLKDVVGEMSPDSREERFRHYRDRLMRLLFSSEGGHPLLTEAITPYLSRPEEIAASLLPDENEREEWVQELKSRT